MFQKGTSKYENKFGKNDQIIPEQELYIFFRIIQFIDCACDALSTVVQPVVKGANKLDCNQL